MDNIAGAVDTMMNCEFCGSPAHVWFNCIKKPDGWKPDRMKQSRPAVSPPDPQRSVAATRKDAGSVATVTRREVASAAQADVIKRGVGRPRIHPDRRAYKAEKERDRRASMKVTHANG